MTILSLWDQSVGEKTFAVQPVFGLAGRFVPKDMMTYDMVILRVPVEKLVGPAWKFDSNDSGYGAEPSLS